MLVVASLWLAVTVQLSHLYNHPRRLACACAFEYQLMIELQKKRLHGRAGGEYSHACVGALVKKDD